MEKLLLYAVLTVAAAVLGASMYMARDRGLIAMMVSGLILYVVPILLISRNIGIVEAAKLVTDIFVKLVDPALLLFVASAFIGYSLGMRRRSKRVRARRGNKSVIVIE